MKVASSADRISSSYLTRGTIKVQNNIIQYITFNDVMLGQKVRSEDGRLSSSIIIAVAMKRDQKGSLDPSSAISP